MCDGVKEVGTVSGSPELHRELLCSMMLWYRNVLWVPSQPAELHLWLLVCDQNHLAMTKQLQAYWVWTQMQDQRKI